MTRNEFLSNLRKRLRRKFTKNEIQEIIADYEGFFITGTNEGKSEDQICEELGDAETIVRELFTESKDGRSAIAFLNGNQIRFICIGVALILFTVFSLFLPPKRNSYIIIAALAVILNFIFGAIIPLAPRSQYKSGQKGFTIIAHILLLFIVSGICAIVCSQIYGAARLAAAQPSTLGYAVWIIICICSAAALIIGLLSLRILRRNAFSCLLAVFNVNAILTFLGSMAWLLKMLTDPLKFSAHFLTVVLSYVTVTGISVLYLLIIRRTRGNEVWKRK